MIEGKNSPHDLLLQKLKTIVKLEQKDITSIKNIFESRSFQKNQTLVGLGQSTKYLYFINSGYLRLFRLVNSKEITRYIAGPNQFLTAFPSFLFDIPSEEE